ncbi:MAG: protein kinase [Pyrinomonadaceae bacterium]
MRECPRCDRCYEDDVLVCPEEDNPTKASLPGGTLLAGRYQLEKRLGRGAMGQVYLARDHNLMAKRAVKTVRPDLLNNEDLQEGEAIARFEREAKTAASIQHPNVVNVTDFGKSPEGIFYLVMEFVEGETLHHLLRREGTLSVARAIALLRQISDGVEAAHHVGILHRDLKPANIFIMQPKRKTTRGNNDGFVKIGDFGLAKIVNEAVSEIDSKSGPASRGIIGTPEFMAPEQMQPNAILDARADIYALGTIAYQMLGGRPPFTGDLAQLIMQKMMNAPQPLSNLRTDLAPSVEHAVMHALAKEASGRPDTVTEWIDELEAAAGDAEEEADSAGESRVIVMAPSGAEIYVDDERKANVGRSGRVILTSIPPGLHVLRVARGGDMDDERVIEIRPDSNEQVIQAQMRPVPSPSQFSPSGSGMSGLSGPHSSIPGVVACSTCGSRFAAGAKFCGRCGGNTFIPVQEGALGTAPPPPPPSSGGYPGGSGQRPAPPKPAPSQYGSVAGAGGMFPCPTCRAPVTVGAKFCGKCGMHMAQAAAPARPAPSPYVPAPAPSFSLCRKCGTNYPPGTRFCGKCGIPIGA